MLQATARITIVRMAVAKSVFTPLMPILASTAVRSANRADPIAYIHNITAFGFEQTYALLLRQPYKKVCL